MFLVIVTSDITTHEIIFTGQRSEVIKYNFVVKKHIVNSLKNDNYCSVMIGSDGGEDAARFFSVKQAEERRDSGASASLNPSTESDEGDRRGCLTIRIFQYLLPCVKRRGVWEPSQGDVFKSHDAEEAKYPKTLRILESPVFDAIFVMSCLASIYLFLFSEGFLIESRLLWGIIHVVNAVYALGLFSQWLQILIKSKYAKTNHGYTTLDIVYTLLSVFPADLIVLAIYTLNDEDDTEESEASNPIQHWMITISRLNYLLRFRSIFQYFSKWENHLVVGRFWEIDHSCHVMHLTICSWNILFDIRFGEIMTQNNCLCYR